MDGIIKDRNMGGLLFLYQYHSNPQKESNRKVEYLENLG